MSAPKTKERVISPCLRLLTEIVAYDGGNAAKHVWHKREITFHRLDVFLSFRNEKTGDQKGPHRKPSVRDNALRYLFANLRLQSSITKAGVLTLAQGKLINAVFHSLEADSPSVIFELLNTFEKHVITDTDLPRNVKRGLFREETLRCIATLYRYQDDLNAPGTSLATRHKAHAVLLLLCASPKHGLLDFSMSHGLQNPEISDEDSGNERPKRMPGKYSKMLSNFLQILRPHAEPLEEDLILNVFKTSPSMLADYFQRKQSFTFEPKLSATWIGYSKFLMSIIQLPVPTDFIRTFKAQPNLSDAVLFMVVDSCLPPPLLPKYLNRCLSQNVELVTMIAIKLIIAAFQKIEQFISLFNENDHTNTILHSEFIGERVARLVDVFQRRCPNVKHVVVGYRQCLKANSLQREAYSRLLVYYYRVIPQSVLEERLDIPMTVADALLNHESSSNAPIQPLELESLLRISRYSPDMHWCHKSGTTDKHHLRLSIIADIM